MASFLISRLYCYKKTAAARSSAGGNVGWPFPETTAQFGCFRSHTQPAAKSRSQPPLLAVTGPICLFSLSFRPYLPVFALLSLWLLTAKRSHSQHSATSHSQNPQSKPRKPAVKISLLTAIAGQVSTHNNEIFFDDITGEYQAAKKPGTCDCRGSQPLDRSHSQ